MRRYGEIGGREERARKGEIVVDPTKFGRKSAPRMTATGYAACDDVISI